MQQKSNLSIFQSLALGLNWPPGNKLIENQRKCTVTSFLTLNGIGSEKSTKYEWGLESTPSLFPLFECQLKQNLVARKYVTNSIRNYDKIDDFITGPLCSASFWEEDPYLRYLYLRYSYLRYLYLRYLYLRYSYLRYSYLRYLYLRYLYLRYSYLGYYIRDIISMKQIFQI